MKKETAIAIVRTARAYSDRLVRMLQHVKQHATEEEAAAYKRAIAHVMGDMYADVLRHIFVEYPELEPEEWKPQRTNVPPLADPIAVRELWAQDQAGQRQPVKVL